MTNHLDRACPDLPPGCAFELGLAPHSYRIDRLCAERYHTLLHRPSSTLLKAMLVSPAHYMGQFTRRRAPSRAMDFGSLIHLLVLEPQRLAHEYVVIPDASSTDERRQAQRLHPGAQLLSEIELEQAQIAADRILARTVLGRPFYRFLEEGRREVTFFYRDSVTGVECRTRMDLWHPQAIFDLKTTRHVTASEFSRACVALDYDLQAYMYCLADALFDGREAARPFVFVALGSDLPHPVHVLTAGESFMRNGQAKYTRAMSLLRACMDTDFWPDNSADGVLDIQPWQAFDERLEPLAACATTESSLEASP